MNSTPVYKRRNVAESMNSIVVLLFIVIISPCLAIYTISDYRLITKDRPNAGIVEVYNQDIGWGLVCQENWNFELASIACSELNFPGTSVHLTAVSFDDDGDEWPKSVTNNISTYFTGCSVNRPNMQCDTRNGEGSCNFYYLIGAVSCQESRYIGCFSDYDRYGPGRDRVLSDGPRDYENILTIDLCINACLEDGYFYAGVENADECFCGRQDENLAKHGKVADGECNYYACAGDLLESCGGSDIIGIYKVDLGVCEDPGTPQNGYRYKETGSLRYGSEIYFNCSDGYTLEGPGVIQCVQMYGRRGNVSIANSTNAVMWNHGLPKCTGFSSTTPSSAATKGGGQTNTMTFSGTTGPEQQSGFSSTTPSSATTKGGGQTNPKTFSGTTDMTGSEQQSGFSSTTPYAATTKGGGQTNLMIFIHTTDMTGSEQQSGHQVIIYTSIGIVFGLIIIIAIILVVVICKRHRRKAERLDHTATGINLASSNHDNGGGNPLMSGGGEEDHFVLTDLTAHSKAAVENHYVDDNEKQPPTHSGSMDRPGISRDAFGYESVRLPSADSAMNGSGGITGEVPVDGATDLYANTEFHDVPTNLIDNELYG